jgi:hypothetical protein
MDLAIGEFALIGQGIGPQIIRDFLGACVWPHPDITAVDPAPGRRLRAACALSKVCASAVSCQRIQARLAMRVRVFFEPEGNIATLRMGDPAISAHLASPSTQEISLAVPMRHIRSLSIFAFVE